MQTIHITNNKGEVVDKVKRMIHELMIHSTDKKINGIAIQTGLIAYKGQRIVAGLEQQDGKQRWTAYNPRG